MIPSENLLPYKSGLYLERIITTVGRSSNLYINGNLPVAIQEMVLRFKENNYPIAGKTFNISLGSIINSNNVNDSTSYPVKVLNN